MSEIQYKRYDEDTTLRDLGLDASGYAVNGTKTTAGAPATTANKFQVGCEITNTSDGKHYINEGSVASPSWVTVTTA